MELANIKSGKKWLLGIDGSKSPLEIGYFEKPKDAMHYHRSVYEYYIVISGRLTLFVDGKDVDLKSGDVCCIIPEEKHFIKTTSKGLRCYLVKWPHKPKDKVLC